MDTRWIDLLEEEDIAFIKRFLLASGSLKELAQAYDVSYPTVRLRLDRLIEKLKILDNPLVADPFERVLRAQLAEGNLELPVFKRLLAAYQLQQGKKP